jgi:hypothetical protein
VEFRSSFPAPCSSASASTFTSKYHFTFTLLTHFANAVFILTSSRTVFFYAPYTILRWQRWTLLATLALAGTKRSAQQHSRSLKNYKHRYDLKPCLRQIGANVPKITSLRSAIPRLVEPFQQPSGPATFKLYSKGVTDSQDGIKCLNEHWKGPETQGIFEHTRKSFAANDDLSASRTIPFWGWAERAKKERDSKHDSRSESTDESSTTLTDEEISRLLVEFQKNYLNIQLETQDDNRMLLVSCLTCHAFLR